jgi:hypothetical protein
MRPAPRQPSGKDLPPGQRNGPAWRPWLSDLRPRDELDATRGHRNSHRSGRGRTLAAAARSARNPARHVVARACSPVLVLGGVAERSRCVVLAVRTRPRHGQPHPNDPLRGPSRHHAVRTRPAEAVPAALHGCSPPGARTVHRARSLRRGRAAVAAGSQRADRTQPAGHNRARRPRRGRDRNQLASPAPLADRVRSRLQVRRGPRCRIRIWRPAARIRSGGRIPQGGHSRRAGHSRRRRADRNRRASHSRRADRRASHSRQADHAPAADTHVRRRIRMHRAGRSHCQALGPAARPDHRGTPGAHGELGTLRARRTPRAAGNRPAGRNPSAARVLRAARTGEEPAGRRARHPDERSGQGRILPRQVCRRTADDREPPSPARSLAAGVADRTRYQALAGLPAAAQAGPLAAARLAQVAARARSGRAARPGARLDGETDRARAGRWLVRPSSGGTRRSG